MTGHGRLGAGPMVRPGRWALLLLAALTAVAPTGAAWAAPAATLAPDSVTALADPGATLAVPADGRLDGYRFAGKVLGVATGTRLGTGATAGKAAAGQKLWVFGLQWTAATDDGGKPQPVSTTVVVDGNRISFPAQTDSPNHDTYNQANSTWDSGPTWWVASVPAAASDVAVELASAGYAQTFSLVRMAREGPQPAALYRSPRDWQVTQPLSQEKDIPTPDPTGVAQNATMRIALSGATLSWFGPDSPSDVPADPGQAWLVPQLSNPADPYSGPSLCYPALPGSAITLTLPGQAPIPARAFAGLGPDRPDFGSFTNAYGFEVPADLTTAALTVTPGTMHAETDNCIDPVTLNVAGSAVFDLTLPPASYTPPPGAASRPAQIRTLAANARTATAAGPGTGRSGGGFPILAVAVPLGVVLLAGGGLAARSRPWSTRRRHPRVPGQPVPAAPTPGGPAGAVDPPAAPPPPPSDCPVSRPTPAPDGPATGADGTGRQARTVLVVPPEEPPPLPDGQLEIQVLGSPRLVGLPPGAPAIGQTALEILVLLAFHRGERLSADQIRTELGRGRDRDLDPATIRRYINDLRRSLGERLPEARTAGGYELLGVGTDVDRFDAFDTGSRSAVGPRDVAREMASALSLVRDAPFSGGSSGTYGWAERSQLDSVLANRIHSAAIGLSNLALQHGDAALAQWAAKRGVLVWSTDDGLSEALLKAAAMVDLPLLNQAWHELRRRYVAVGETEPQQLYELYQSLRRGFSSPDDS